MAQPTPFHSLTGVVLAGGKGSRMGGQDKGLLLWQGKPLVEHVLAGLRPQVNTILLNANRHLERYQQYGHTVVSDHLAGYTGPLAGLAASLAAAPPGYVLAAPCDSPRLPPDLAQRLWAGLQQAQADIAVAHDGNRQQNLHVLLSTQLLPNLQTFLAAGGRKVEAWYGGLRLAVVDFSDCHDLFRNFNHLSAWAGGAQAVCPPVLGICGWSGSGKTTLLSAALPHLHAAGLRVAVIKHGHHKVDLDTPGKDTYRFRQAGAAQVVFATQRTLAVMHPCQQQPEVELLDALRLVDNHCADLVLVEGFKHAPIPKIEVYRPALGKPALYPTDSSILAVASDVPALPSPATACLLDLNQAAEVAAFIQQWRASSSGQ